MTNDGKTTTARRRRRWNGLWMLWMGGTFVTAGLLDGCKTSGANFPVAPACQDETRAQALLIDLARQALIAFGRIDPFLYDLAKLAPLDSVNAKDEGARNSFAKVLAKVVNDGLAGKAFKANLEAALDACKGDACSARDYPITLEPIELKLVNSSAYTYEIKAEPPPSDAQIKAFDLLYSLPSSPGGCDDRPDGLVISTATRGVLRSLYDSCDERWPRPHRNDPCEPPDDWKWRETSTPWGVWLCCNP